MYCGHCAPCPKGIAVADVTKFLNLTKAQGMVPETVAQHYGALTAHGGDCIECGACETRCPLLNSSEVKAENSGRTPMISRNRMKKSA